MNVIRVLHEQRRVETRSDIDAGHRYLGDIAMEAEFSLSLDFEPGVEARDRRAVGGLGEVGEVGWVLGEGDEDVYFGGVVVAVDLDRAVLWRAGERGREREEGMTACNSKSEPLYRSIKNIEEIRGTLTVVPRHTRETSVRISTTEPVLDILVESTNERIIEGEMSLREGQGCADCERERGEELERRVHFFFSRLVVEGEKSRR